MRDLQTYLDVRGWLEAYLEEDLGFGDITTDSTIAKELKATGEIVCKSSGQSVISGIDEAAAIFEMCGCTPRIVVNEGQRVARRTVVLQVNGNARAILKAERTALNLLMRMSGIATTTMSIVEQAGKRVTVLATRKTAPGLRYFDKKAVIAGNGKAHRMRLDDMALIKDNHIKLGGGVAKCLKAARRALGSEATIECEVTTFEEAVIAIRSGADIVMLDNFEPKDAASTISGLHAMGLKQNVKTEISGGVDITNVKRFGLAGADYVSLGFLTHSSKAIDFSLEIG